MTMTKSKRIFSLLLCCLLLAGLLPTSAFAYTEQTGTPYFDFSYESDGTEIMYHDSFTLGGYSAGSSDGTEHRVRVWINDEEAYCIEPGHHLILGDTLTLSASEMWNQLSPNVQNAIKTVLAFGRPGNGANIGGSDGSQTVATQLLIWEFVCGARDPVTFECSTDVILNSICKGNYHPEVRRVYYNIVNDMNTYHVMPSFADGAVHEMSYTEGKYTLTLTDGNGVLAGCNVSSSNPGVQVAKNGNNLTITAMDYVDGDVTITFTKSSGISASSQLVTYGDPNLQDVIVGIAKPEDIVANIKVSTPGGNVNIVKTSEDGVVAGIPVTISGDEIKHTVTTGQDGSIELNGLVPGTYTVAEQTADYYEPQEPQQITVNAGEPVKVSFRNVLKKGNLTVVKNAEDNANSGITFHLYGTAASGQTVDLFATTDSAGVASFRDIPISGANGYTLEEVNVSANYVIPATQNVQIFWNEVTNTVFVNTLKKFKVDINKTDAETGTAQGNATLSGASYGLYDGDTLVETLIIDENGHSSSVYHGCGDAWTIKEITAPEGYLLDKTAYSVAASASSYTVELNNAPAVNPSDRVIKGQISIIKHHDNGSTQIETPEKGAEFQIYLSSAGNYDNTAEAERDTLVCDEDGFAISKKLPYGIYTVHQTKGFPETEFMPDFTVFVAQDGQIYKYLINNAPYKAYIKVVKADKETRQKILLSGAGFQIYNASGEKVTMTCTYPELTTVDTFYVSEDSSLLTPQALEVGNYTLVETQAPYGYVLDSTPVPFSVTSSAKKDLGNVDVIEVTVYDQAQKGTINVSKSGEMFVTVNNTGDTVPAEKLGKAMTPSSSVYTPVYEMRGLPGATYQIIAATDIVTGDGTVRAKAGDIVDEITTGADGAAVSRELYLGCYAVCETVAPEGYTLDTEAHQVELTYAGQEVSITSVDTDFKNQRQKVAITAEKELETNDVFGIGIGSEITAVSFGLYAAEDIFASDGSALPKDGLIEIAFADGNGHIAFTSDLPFGNYYVKELSCDPHYVKDETKYSVSFTYTGQDTAVVEIALNDGHAIVNELYMGRIDGRKVDKSDAALGNATFGLFSRDTTEFTANNAILTVSSDENGVFAFEDVPLGDYLVVELAAPTGYVLSDVRHIVSLTSDVQEIILKVINDPIFGGIELTKVDKDYPDHHLTGATFELYADTDCNGKYDAGTDNLLSVIPEVNEGIYRLMDLPYGTYFVKEKTPPVGFLPDNGVYTAVIDEPGKLVQVENEPGKCFANSPISGSVTISKTGKDGKKLVGAGFRIFDDNKNAVAEGVTGENGTVTFNLRYGKYTVAEYAAPKGYVLDETPMPFEITENGQALNFDMKNLPISGKLVISKVDSVKEQPLSGAKFRVFNAEGKVVGEDTTGKDGTCVFELEFGKYTCQEIEAPKGYKLEEAKLEFSINENGKVVSAVMANKPVSESTPTPTPKPSPAPTSSPTPTPTPTSTPTPGKPDGPKTGDNSHVDVWAITAAVALLSGIAALTVVYCGKQKKLWLQEEQKHEKGYDHVKDPKEEKHG